MIRKRHLNYSMLRFITFGWRQDYPLWSQTPVLLRRDSNINQHIICSVDTYSIDCSHFKCFNHFIAILCILHKKKFDIRIYYVTTRVCNLYINFITNCMKFRAPLDDLKHYGRNKNYFVYHQCMALNAVFIMIFTDCYLRNGWFCNLVEDTWIKF